RLLLSSAFFPYTTLFRSFVWRIDYTQPIGSLLIVNLIEVFVDDLEERLLFMMTAYLSRGGSDSGIVRIKTAQGAFFEIASEESSDRKSTRLNSSHVKISY